VPLTLLSLDEGTQVAVVEMGMRGKGQIAALSRWVEPDVGLITNVHPVHLELLGSLEDIAEAKAEIWQYLPPDGIVVLPVDCPLLTPRAQATGRRLVSFGLGEGAQAAEVWGRIQEKGRPAPPRSAAWQVQGKVGASPGLALVGRDRISPPVSQAVLELRWPGGEAELEVCAYPRHRLQNLVAAVAACYAAGLPLPECLAGLHEVSFTGGRGEVLHFPGLVLIDDTYNASPAAVKEALADLRELAAEVGGRAVAVLG
ncbi:MAG: hypothetical protein H5T84_05835, partial [Thermoleophilia bacterium]|nr:hypothetical protein [Thermoleophilia bacterium]